MKNSVRHAGFSILALTLSLPIAHAEITANVALTSDYVWRGISQNQEDPALQGGFDYAHDSGFYAGVWGSNVNFGGASTELDLYAGWGTEFENGLSIDMGTIEYTYHGSPAAGGNDFTEYYLGAGYAGFGLTYSIGDEFGDQYEFSYGYDFEKFSVSAAYANYDIADDGNDYDYYSVGISGTLAELGWDVSYYDTDIKGIEEAEGRLVLSISKEF